MLMRRVLALALALALAVVHAEAYEFVHEYEYERATQAPVPTPLPTPLPTPAPTPLPTPAPTAWNAEEACARLCAQRGRKQCTAPTDWDGCACRRTKRGKCRGAGGGGTTKPTQRCLKWCPKLAPRVCASTGAALGCRCVPYRKGCIAKPV